VTEPSGPEVRLMRRPRSRSLEARKAGSAKVDIDAPLSGSMQPVAPAPGQPRYGLAPRLRVTGLTCRASAFLVCDRCGQTGPASQFILTTLGWECCAVGRVDPPDVNV
jgi:hypothetical protein